MTGLVSEYLTNKFIPRGSSSGIVTEKPLRGVVDKVLYCIIMYATLKKKMAKFIVIQSRQVSKDSIVSAILLLNKELYA